MRRRMGRPLRRMLAPDVPPLLMQANRLLSDGNYLEAANALEQLARAAEARGGPRAPFLHIQAGRARVMAGQPVPAMESLERGLGLLAVRRQSAKLASFGGRLVTELNHRGLAAEAGRLTDYLRELSPDIEVAASITAPSRQAPLPTHCPACGAPLRPDEVEWLDEATAECAFCGSPIRGR